jgi:hypothetical protein
MVDVGLYERQDKPVEQFLNFKTLLVGIGRGGETALAESLRVLEVDVNGVVIDEAVPFQFEPLTQDSGNLVFLLTGTSDAQTQRDYHLYFDTARDFAPADFEAQVEVVDGVPDEGQLCYETRTLSLWVNASVQEDMNLVSWGADQPGALWALSIVRGGGRAAVKGPIQLDAGASWITGGTSLIDSRWYHVAVVLESGESARVRDIRVYVDGRLDLTSRISDGSIDTLTGPKFRFGIPTGDRWVPFNGLLDEVRIYSRALAPEEIAELAGVGE